MARIRVTGLDHIVLNVSDVDRSLKFYTDILGLSGERVEDFNAGKVGFPSVRINEQTIIDLIPAKEHSQRAAGEKIKGNLNHFCLVTNATDFPATVDELKHHGVMIREGPVSRWGAQGQATSIYFLDPDGNEIEIRCY